MRTTASIVVAVGTFLLVLAVGKQALADPTILNIQGTVANGQTVIINGSGFGTKNPAKPVIWANFEGQAVGATPVADSNLSEFPNTFFVQGALVTNLGSLPPHSTRAARGDVFTGNKLVGADIIGVNPPGTRSRYLFIFNRRRYEGTGFFGTTTNFKFHRHHPTGTSLNPGETDLNLVYNPQPGQVHYLYQWEGSGMLSTFNGKSVPVNQWFTEEFQVDKGTPNGNNAQWKYWENGALLANLSGQPGTTSAGDTGFGNIKLEGQWANGAVANSAWMYWDDVYIDTTWARVMIGDQPTFSGSTHREIQIPLTWSPGQITITVNQGSFSSLSNVFLYVIDSNGTVNSVGFPTCPGCPVSPGNLRAQ